MSIMSLVMDFNLKYQRIPEHIYVDSFLKFINISIIVIFSFVLTKKVGKKIGRIILYIRHMHITLH